MKKTKLLTSTDKLDLSPRLIEIFKICFQTANKWGLEGYIAKNFDVCESKDLMNQYHVFYCETEKVEEPNE